MQKTSLHLEPPSANPHHLSPTWNLSGDSVKPLGFDTNGGKSQKISINRHKLGFTRPKKEVTFHQPMYHTAGEIMAARYHVQVTFDDGGTGEEKAPSFKEAARTSLLRKTFRRLLVSSL